jgi:CRP-like cAMP-binding protein
MTLIEAAVFREWVTNVGGRSAYARIAHLLCELMIRLKAVGQGDKNTCAFPFTQAKLGEATGLSIVHVNRSLQALRQDGLITLKAGELRIRNWDATAEAGDFDPTYLHLKQDESR